MAGIKFKKRNPPPTNNKTPEATLQRHAIFVAEYILAFNGTQAAIAAGYSPDTAGSTASRLLKDVNIQQMIADAVSERRDRLEINADYVLHRLVEIDQMRVSDILNDDGSLKNISDWPDTWNRTLSGIELTELFDGRGDEKTLVGILKKIKWPDKQKNLDMLGKHIDVQAWEKDDSKTSEMPDIVLSKDEAML